MDEVSNVFLFQKISTPSNLNKNTLQRNPKIKLMMNSTTRGESEKLLLLCPICLSVI